MMLGQTVSAERLQTLQRQHTVIFRSSAVTCVPWA